MSSTLNIPAEIGLPISEIDTPALLIELDVLEENVRRMAHYSRQHAIALRPHAKTHKSVDLARIQLSNGATGICCQKVSEAEVFVHGGIGDVLITNQIVGPVKINRLLNLARQASVSVCVDNAENISALDDAAHSHEVVLGILVEVDVGGGRCGAAPGSATLDLARQIDASRYLKFLGLHAYRGNAQHIRDYTERCEAIQATVSSVVVTVDLLKEDGIGCQIITGAGTGTYPFETTSGIYTELQCGSYVFMDADYASLLMSDGSPKTDFSHSLFVLTSVMSKPSAHKAVCDAGLKAHSVDSGLPLVHDPASIRYLQASDEHGLLSDPGNRLSIGDKLRLIPGHCDPTVNLYDWYVGVRNGSVETIWPVSGRGMVL